MSNFSDLCPNCAAYYGNRSATYIMLQKFKDGLADAQYALQLDTGFVKVGNISAF